MKVDYALILAAGLGTRMGAIGNLIPKLLWPVFEKTLLELQIAFVKELNIKNIFINLHYKYEDYYKFLLDKYDLKKDIIILDERDELLDVGGAVHNLAQKVDYTGNLLLLGADQFIMFDKTFIDEALSLLENRDSILFLTRVDAASGYNETVIDENRKLIGVKKSVKHDFPYYTYSATSLIKLNSLQRSTGPSNFFKTVADFEKLEIGTLGLEKYEYWDFGTAKRYYSTLLRLKPILTSVHPNDFVSFLKRNNAFKDNFILNNDYLGNFISIKDNKVIIGKVTNPLIDSGIYYKDLIEVIDD